MTKHRQGASSDRGTPITIGELSSPGGSEQLSIHLETVINMVKSATNRFKDKIHCTYLKPRKMEKAQYYLRGHVPNHKTFLDTPHHLQASDLSPDHKT